MPNISKTGFKEIDENYKPKELESDKKKKKKINLNLLETKKEKFGFKDYLNDHSTFCSYPDLDV